MKRNHITSCLAILTLIVFSLSMSGCLHKDKEVVVTKNVKVGAKQDKNQIKKNIELGNKLLGAEKYSDAKNAYNKAISLDKMNKATYLTINDMYLKKDRLQDAADIIQEAIDNHVDVANMKTILSQIKARIEASTAIKQYSLSQKTNQKPKQNSNTQDKPAVEQSKKIIGFVKNIYEKNGKRYLTIDEAKFYRGDAAAKACAADGYPGAADMDDYYISNKDKTISEYEISNNCVFNVQKWQLHEKTINNGAETDSTSYDTIKAIVKANTDNVNDQGCTDNRGNLYWLIINNNVVGEMDAQYTP